MPVITQVSTATQGDEKDRRVFVGRRIRVVELVEAGVPDSPPPPDIHIYERPPFAGIICYLEPRGIQQVVLVDSWSRRDCVPHPTTTSTT